MVREGLTLFARGYGYAEVETARRVNADTAFHIASVSKTVTGAAMMLLCQDGAFKLDDAVAPHLDFPAANPKFPDVPITFRHLFTHTSSICDDRYDGFQVEGDPALPLHDFLEGYLSPKGKFFAPDQCYCAARPGTEWRYSNVAVALLGYLAGRVGKTGLAALTQARLFAPLRMRNTAWTVAALAGHDLALPYAFENGRYRKLPVTGYPDWPAGLLRTSANDFARFLAIFTARPSPLKPETLKAILTPGGVLPNPAAPSVRQGLSWLLIDHKGAHLAAHRGGDPGAGSLAMFDTGRRTAALAFANVDSGHAVKAFQDEAVTRLLDRARKA